MGEVYRALDTRLDRVVAIKVLKEKFSERFEREARAISALNHAHICTLYDVGPDYLVMEHVEGKPLHGPLPLDEALRYAVQIAEALDAAHRKGIIHRDLKPGNILITKSGVKLLDFGLAAMHPPPAVAAAAPMATLPMTQAGEIVGSLQYMSPEQLEGKPADERSDIFAFGLVLYEMLAGKPAFTGTSQASLIAAIMHEQPPSIATVQPLTPTALDRVVKTCLAKDPDDRWQSAREVRHALGWILAEPAGPAPRASHGWLPWAVAAVLAVALVFVAATRWRITPSATQKVRLSIEAPEGTTFPFSDYLGGQAISPDGRMLAFIAMRQDTKPILYVRPLDSLAFRALAGTEGAVRPFWSPDSRTIGFFAAGKLQRVDAGGGVPQVVCEGVRTSGGGSWSRDGVILFSDGNVILRVAASGGSPTRATTLPANGSEWYHRNPQILPDGKHFLYQARTTKNPFQSSLNIGTLDDPQGKHTTRLLSSSYNAIFAIIPGRADQGFLLFVRGATLMAQPFDAYKLALGGQPEVVAENLRLARTSIAADFSASETGVLVYSSGLPLRLTWRDRVGRSLRGSGDLGEYPRLSPDGKRIVFQRPESNAGQCTLWVADVTGGGETRLTSINGRLPIWSPDSRDILYTEPGYGLRRQRANGMGEDGLLPVEQYVYAEDWSSDGKHVLFGKAVPNNFVDLWVLPLMPRREVFPYRKTPFMEWHARLSPDGHWVSYISNEQGSYQVFVQGFPEASGSRQISVDGALYVTGWRRDGRELFYETAAGDVMAVPVETSTNDFRFEAPKRLFRLSEGSNGDVSADGQRFIFAEPGEKQATLPLTVVLNWQAGLTVK